MTKYHYIFASSTLALAFTGITPIQAVTTESTAQQTSTKLTIAEQVKAKQLLVQEEDTETLAHRRHTIPVEEEWDTDTNGNEAEEARANER